MHVAFDEQIFAIQRYGGISRQFAELAKQFMQHPEFKVDLQPMNVPVVNRYLLDSPDLSDHLRVTGVTNSYRALAHFSVCQYCDRQRRRSLVGAYRRLSGGHDSDYPAAR